MTDRMKIVHEIGIVAESFYDEAKKFGDGAAKVLKDKRAQITGLENVANNSVKVTDVFNYVKTRTARQEQWRKQNLGSELLNYLEKELGRKRDELLKTPSIATEMKDSQEVYILLIREFVRQLAAQYEYKLLEM